MYIGNTILKLVKFNRLYELNIDDNGPEFYISAMCMYNNDSIAAFEMHGNIKSFQFSIFNINIVYYSPLICLNWAESIIDALD